MPSDFVQGPGGEEEDWGRLHWAGILGEVAGDRRCCQGEWTCLLYLQVILWSMVVVNLTVTMTGGNVV